MGNVYNLPVTTAFILAERAVLATCGQESIDWGISLLSKGREEDSVLRLASRTPPHNHFEIARDRDNILSDLGISHIEGTKAIHIYVYELLTSVIEKSVNLRDALKIITDFYLSNDCDRTLNDFYMLGCTFNDLEFENFSYHWRDANRTNIQHITIKEIERFLANRQDLRTKLP